MPALGDDDVLLLDPPPLDQAEWDKAATDWAIGSLDLLRDTAEKWLGSLSTLIGLFGAVVIIGGPETLADIQPRDARPWIFGALVVASLLAGTAVLFGAFAAQGLSFPTVDGWNGDAFAAYQLNAGETTVRQLLISRVCGILAAALVLGAGLTAAGLSLVPRDVPVDEQYAAVVTADGESRCGLISSINGQLAVSGQVVKGAVQIVPVAGC
jgi:hypothetical protein